jgi:adenylosuccinate synthase
MRTERVILLSGHISSGKSTLASGLAQRYGMNIFKTRDVLLKRVKDSSQSRRHLQLAGDKLDKKTKGAWIIDELLRWLPSHPGDSAIIVDSIRTSDQASSLRAAFGSRVIHVHLTAPLEELEKRYESRTGPEGTQGYSDALQNETESHIDDLADIADVVIDTKRCSPEDVLVRAASHLKLNPDMLGFVDVIVGGQYGSEGKGQIAAYLSGDYDLLVRVGGPNAGHKVYEEPEPFTHHQLPSGTRRCEVPLLIGPGATINVEKLLEEVAECKVGCDRLRIDPNTMIITKADINTEKRSTNSIGSTAQGVGVAMSRRITGRLKSKPPLLAKDIPILRPYLGNAMETLADVFYRGGRVLLEGTQGAGLSLYHGYYPHVTSRDTNVSGCLAEAGIPPSRVRRIVMVCRTYPIRVESPAGGSSGPMSQEITMEEIAKRSGKSVEEIQHTEITSTTYRKRRIGEFEWDLLQKCRPSAIMGHKEGH